MNNQKHQASSVSGWMSLFGLAGLSIVSLLVGQFFGYAIALPFCNYDTTQVNSLLTSPETIPNARFAILLMQAASSGTLFIISPIIFIKFFQNESFSSWIGSRSQIKTPAFALLGLIVLVYMPLSGFLVKINQSIELPASLQLLEASLKSLEAKMEKTVLFLIDFQNIIETLLGFGVIALLAGVGEEFLFRGILQGILQKIFKNIHVAIWVTALLFSVLHFQFYGILPRAVLGALFGYLYYYSGSMLVPATAHFLNNAFTLTAMQVAKQNGVNMTASELPEMPLGLVIGSAVATVILTLYFKKLYPRKQYIKN